MINRFTLNECKTASTSQLQKRLKDALAFAEEHPQFKEGWHNEYVQYLKMTIASRIGKK